MEGLSPADISALNGNNGFGGNGMWLFALLILFGMGGNGFGYNGRNVATADDLNFGRLENQVRANENYIQNIGTSLGNGISSLGYEMAQQFGNTNTTMATGFCNLSKEILDSRYAVSQQISALSQKMDAEKIASLTAEVNNLKTKQAIGEATCGIVRYPMSASYSAPNPFCNCNNNCSNI